METKEMIKCEGCGQYHPIEDCEVVIIKIIKGKQCAMPAQGQTVIKEVVREVAPVEQTGRVVVETIPIDQSPKPRKNIVPPGIAAMMLPPDHPMHDSRGAKEIRKV